MLSLEKLHDFFTQAQKTVVFASGSLRSKFVYINIVKKNMSFGLQATVLWVISFS